ncbi:c-type cytochrome [Litoreibacter janthinus]|uniref:Cytochrome c n=1 Tax=Litoreibacter janthinus TaxID=670154 RepID=A0A1I6GUU7_9RHOB|nr:c-type cytochrome [Litoreibacter janthinus]SFR45896.1 cytochrome c [Litoreibacter janthinus]
MGRSQLFASLAILAGLSGTPGFAGAAYESVKIEAGKTLFDAECHRCHADNSSDPSYGPSLSGIVGRAAGTHEGYDYSEALSNAPIVWTPAALRAWMEDNTGFMPGTKMRHVGITDRTVQDFILSYLATLAE